MCENLKTGFYTHNNILILCDIKIYICLSNVYFFIFKNLNHLYLYY